MVFCHANIIKKKIRKALWEYSLFGICIFFENLLKPVMELHYFCKSFRRFRVMLLQPAATGKGAAIPQGEML
jgi:hypothetical protein